METFNMEEKLKTAEEILDDYVYDINDHGDPLVSYNGALAAMERYLAQYQNIK
jgi:hypothetical protein